MRIDARVDWQKALAEMRDYARTHPFAGMGDETKGKPLEEAVVEIRGEALKRAEEGQFEPFKCFIALDGIIVSVMFTVQSMSGAVLYSLSLRRPLGDIPPVTIEKIIKEAFGSKKVASMKSPLGLLIYMCKEMFD